VHAEDRDGEAVLAATQDKREILKKEVEKLKKMLKEKEEKDFCNT
jgi:predicted transcriptional regulator